MSNTNPLKTGVNYVWSRRVSSTCSISGTHHVIHVTTPVIRHDWVDHRFGYMYDKQDISMVNCDRHSDHKTLKVTTSILTLVNPGRVTSSNEFNYAEMIFHYWFNIQYKLSFFWMTLKRANLKSLGQTNYM